MLYQRMIAALFAALAWACAQTAAAAPPAPPPAAVFFKPDTMAQAALSPSGRWLMALSAGPTGRVGFVVVDLDGKEKAKFIQAGEKDDVGWFRWVNDDWLVFRVIDPLDRTPGGMGGGLMSVSRDGKESRMLISRQWTRRVTNQIELSRKRALEPSHYFLGMGTPGTNEVVVAENHWDVRGQFSHTTLKALNVETAAARSLALDAPEAREWWLDAQGRPRASASEEAGVVTLRWLDAGTNTWKEIAKAPQFKLPFVPSFFQADGQLVVASTNAGDSLELRRFDVGTMKPGGDVLVTTPGFDSGATQVLDPGRTQTLGVRVEVDATSTVWFTPAMQALQNRVDAKLAGRINIVTCAPCTSTGRVLVYSYTDRDPGSFLLYTPATEDWQLIGKRRPDIDPAQMASTDLHRTTTRDGLNLPVWVTRPSTTGTANAGPAPTVVLVHGGPHVRGGDWRWRAEAQFFASRGYVVVEPEFRGSFGYGNRYMHAGFKQWGLAMQDDISDALKFAVAQGWSDAARVCIVGGSYGGYAALMGVVKDPDQYRCAVAFAAVTDQRAMFDMHWNDFSAELREFGLPVTIGDRKADEARFIATSPIEQVQRIKAPVLLVHGTVDRRVPIQNGERMRDAMRKAGKSVEWVEYDEGHGFFYEKNWLDYYGRVEAFLAKYLKE